MRQRKYTVAAVAMAGILTLSACGIEDEPNNSCGSGNAPVTVEIDGPSKPKAPKGNSGGKGGKR